MSSSTTSYFSPASILTDAHKIPCTFDLAQPHLAALNAQSPITPGTKLDLPLWLAEMLAVSKPGGPGSASLATVDFPDALGPRVLNALRADPKSVDLRALAMWFYGLGGRMLELFEEEEVLVVLEDTFKARALEIADKAQNTRAVQQGADGNAFTTGLDETERGLFRAAHDGTNAVKKWFEQSTRT